MLLDRYPLGKIYWAWKYLCYKRMSKMRLGCPPSKGKAMPELQRHLVIMHFFWEEKSPSIKSMETVLLEFTVKSEKIRTATVGQDLVLTSGSDITIIAVQKTISNPDICPTCCISQLSLANAALSNEAQ